MGGRMRFVVGGLFKRRRRHMLFMVAITVSSIAMLVVAGLVEGFARDLLINIGASMVLVIATYVVFNPMFAELRTASVIDHPRLDLDGFVRSVASSTSLVAVLETWTGLLETRYRDKFFDAARAALRNHATIRILLLDPDSQAAAQRTKELGGKRDVVAEVTENLRSLHQFRGEELPESVRDKLEVRIYSLAPAVQMYRWDDKAFISFYPAGELAYDTTQIETYLQTPLGQFVESRFDDLWDDSQTRTLERYMLLDLRITDPNGESEEFSVDFVHRDDTTFISTRGLGRYLGHRFADLSVHIDGGGPTFQLATVDAELQENVDLLFRRKYGTDRDTVVRLVPWSA